MAEKQLTDLNLQQLCERRFFPSPAAWEDEALYFLMLDRFSDGNELGYKDNDGRIVTTGTTPKFQPADRDNALQTPQDAALWREAGGKWVGGTLQGLRSKIGYLARLGITAIWVSPVFKQVSFQDTYHGYGIQNFLDVDPHFGSREDLKEMVETAHEHGIRVILDVIFNHAGNVFRYDARRYPEKDDNGVEYFDPRWDGNPYDVLKFHDRQGQPSIPFGPVDLAACPSAWPDGACWPAELQQPSAFTKKGRISNWDNWPEFLEGDFCDLKDIHHGAGPVDYYQPSATLRALCDAYKFWIAYADIDGFRVDTVKHMDEGATRFLTSVIHEFAQRIGKDRFYLIGEITGGRERAFHTLRNTGMDAALGIDDIPDRLAYLVKGYRNPSEYFDLFRNSILVNRASHAWFRDKVVTMVDDHDQVYRGNCKARFCAGENGRQVVFNVLALNAMTLGIPCVYYGTEQSFDGAGDSDRYIREAMFGGAFGPFRSRNRHCFDEDNPLCREFAKILKIRREHIALRRGRQYLREISGNGIDFGLPQMIGNEIRSVVPWSRILDDQEMLLAINTDSNQPLTVWVTIDDQLHQTGDQLCCIYSTNPGQVNQEIAVTARNGKAVELTVPAAGFVIFE